MNEQSPMQNSQSEPFDRRAARKQRRAERLAERLADPSRGGGWVAGLILIVLGGMFLLRNTGNFDIPLLENWWALFILIPAISAFDTALRAYRHADNQVTAVVGSSLLVGLVLTAVATAFLFGISWGYFGPLLIILTGFGIIFNYTRQAHP